MPSVAVGRTPTSMENCSGLPSSGRSPRSSLGSPTGSTPASSMACTYQRESPSRTASSSSALRPTRRMTTGGGTLPLRNPGMRRLRPTSRAARCRRFSTSAAGTSASTRTRLSGSSVTLVFTVGKIEGGASGRWARWALALGVGRWALALGVGRWALGVGRWALGVGRWALGVGRWALGVGARVRPRGTRCGVDRDRTCRLLRRRAGRLGSVGGSRDPGPLERARALVTDARSAQRPKARRPTPDDPPFSNSQPN